MEADSPLKQPIINIKCLRLWKMRVDGDKHTRTSAAALTHTSGPRRRPRRCRQTETASMYQIITSNKAPRRDEFRGIFEKCFQRFLTKKQSLKVELISYFKIIMLVFCWWSHVEKRQSQKKVKNTRRIKMQSGTEISLTFVLIVRPGGLNVLHVFSSASECKAEKLKRPIPQWQLHGACHGASVPAWPLHPHTEPTFCKIFCPTLNNSVCSH